ncbi:MAG: DGQHR domain-containing protein [Pseudomonadota bacterium]|nr:DGQHR domain-containing protein [Pseudomonadota bacterium]QKK05704.1 MAG: DGQHR domain-containing protein [Pseudomonadota bacterium]
MQTESRIFQGKEYLLLDVEPIYQKSKVFYLAKMKAKDLVEMFTVSPTQYDIDKNKALASSFVSDADYYQDLVEKLEKRTPRNDDRNTGFQRELRKDRAKAINKYLAEEEYPFFPNTIIASCELINDIEEAGLNTSSGIGDFESLENRPDRLGFLYKDDGEHYRLLLPKMKGAVLVIDGQHRLEGLRLWLDNEQNADGYNVLVSFIVGYDRSVIAKQFYTINYEQKSVNKSLLLHLTAEFSQDLDEVTFLHNLVKILNEHEDSPFLGRIKMLGVTPEEARGDERYLYSVSQAFLIEHMKRFIDKKFIDSKAYTPIFLYYFQHRNMHIDIIRFLSRYFLAIKELKSDWNDPQNSILSKGMGIGAFLVALHTIFPIIFVNDLGRDPNKIGEVSVDYFKNVLSGIENVNFTRSGDFTGVGSSGTVTKIKNAILDEIGYRDNGEVEEFQKWLRSKTKF